MLYASIAANQKTYHDKNIEFQKLYNDREKGGYENLPLNFQDLIFNYINDINTIISI